MLAIKKERKRRGKDRGGKLEEVKEGDEDEDSDEERKDDDDDDERDS